MRFDRRLVTVSVSLAVCAALGTALTGCASATTAPATHSSPATGPAADASTGASTGAGKVTSVPMIPGLPPGDKPCPVASQWQGGGVPTTIDGTPANTPQAEELSQAVGRLGRGAFASVYGSQITDYPVGRVAVCLTDPTQGPALVAAVRKADPKADVSRLDVYWCRYSEQRLDAAVGGMASVMPETDGFPIYMLSPATDGSGIDATTTAKGVASTSLRAALELAARGIPVTLSLGSPATAAVASAPMIRASRQ